MNNQLQTTEAVPADALTGHDSADCISPWRAAKSIAVAALLCVGLGVSSLTSAQSCTPVTTVDWIATAAGKDPLAAPVRPADCMVTNQTPPDFGWPDLAAGTTYQVVLTYPGGQTKTLSAPLNWLNWNETLPSGMYGWQVRATTSSGTQTSQTRHFTIGSGAQTFLVPDATTLFNRATAKAHPRSLPDSATLTTMLGQRQAGVTALRSAADAALKIAPQTQPASSSSAINADLAHQECLRTLNAGFAYVATKQSTYLTDAVRRLKNLAAWNPTGSTGYATAGMNATGREITWTMALVYDWLQPQLDQKTRTSVLATLRTRAAALNTDVIGTRSRVAVHPFDSQGNVTLTALAATSVLLAGDVSDAKTWLTNALPLSLNLLSPWGGPDGGNAIGTMQAQLDLGDSLVPLYALLWAIAVDAGQKGWVKNSNNFMAYFIPPGSPTGRFGDGAEVSRPENWSRVSKGATWLAPTPLGRWYVSQPQLQAGDMSRLEILLAPPADFTTAAFPSGTANTAVFAGVGWAAMHSDLANPNRTSVYFKSSPFGAFDHAHADQNSFAIDAGGARLAIDSGYYDYFKSPHWLNWYKQTKAHNAITFDGGLGQSFYESGGKVTRGRLTNYVHGSDYEIVYGDATPAYDGALTAAQRALVYLSPNLILVYDKLASSASRQWEWNIHSLNQMTGTTGTTAKITNGSQSLCVNVLGGPATGFRQSNLFTSNPTGTWAAQWHGTFYSTTRSTTAEFVTLLNVGCLADTTTPTPTATKTNEIWTVNAGKKTMFIDKGVITVAAAGTTLPGPTPAPTPTGTQPYTGTPVALPGRVEAENYDRGGEGVAYHDSTSGNSGNVYRADAVDVVRSCDTTGGNYAVGYITTGEWLNYTVNVATTGNYDIALRVANPLSTGTVHLEIDGRDVTGPITGFKTASWCDFTTVTKTGVPLTAGTHVLKFNVDSQYLDINAITFSLVSQTVSPAGTTIPTATQIVDANRAVWTVSGGAIYRNGAPAGATANVVLLYWDGTSIYQSNAAGGWWLWTGTAWQATTNPLCSRANPTVSPAPATGAVVAGGSLTYSVSVRNNDAANCGSSSFNLAATAPSGLSRTLSATTLSLAPAASGTVNLTMGTTSSTLAGSYIIAASATNAANTASTGSGTATLSVTQQSSTSPAGTAIPPATQIVDANRDVWTVSGGAVYRNGVAAGATANVVLLYWNGTSIYQSNSAGGWWRWTGSAWEATTDPTAPTTPPPPPPPPPPTGELTTLTLPSTGTRAINTFHSIGAYWTPGTNPGTAGCRLQYKKSTDTTWREALAMWYDSRNSECRGSVVLLQPGTSYDLQFSLPGQAPSRQLRTQTWSETFPIARTVTQPAGTSSSMLTISEGGSPTGYVLYTTNPTTASVIDVGNARTYNIQVNASYVIIRGLTLRGAQADAIRLSPNVHDVVIENNDISGWGRPAGGNSTVGGYPLGLNKDSAVGAECASTAGSLVRIIIQRNRIHDPRYGANSWSEGHPLGPNGIRFGQCGGNHVFRYNEITSRPQHYFMDGMGGAENFSTVGFPNSDTDIYGNIITHAWDDAIEAEGGNRNVRIWNNYFDQTAVGVATTTTAVGPVYIFRNVQNRARTMEGSSLDSDNRYQFSKAGTEPSVGGARRYIFHNTLLQASQSGVTKGLGVASAVVGTSQGSFSNTVSRNNIYHLWTDTGSMVGRLGADNDFGYDLYNSSNPVVTEVNGIHGRPTYATGHGWTSESRGLYQLAPSSLGYDRGARIANFNDSFTGTAPDIGAHEAGTSAMSFGVNATTVPQ